jgi:hypothetical protein
MNWSTVMEFEELLVDVTENGWTEVYREKLRRLSPESALTESDSDQMYQDILEDKTAVEE